MMTETRVIAGTKSMEKLKRIQFEKTLFYDGSVSAAAIKPHEWDCIVLLSTGTSDSDSFDVMYAYNKDNPQSGCVYLGRWNGGRMV